MSGRTLQLRAIPAPLAREPARRCEQCALKRLIRGDVCQAPEWFIRACAPRGDSGHVIVLESDALFAERAVRKIVSEVML